MKTVDDFIAEKRGRCSASLRMIGTDDGEGWALIRLLWTVEYWKERAENAEAALNESERHSKRHGKDDSFSIDRWLEASRLRAEIRKRP